ncbi:MAG: alanine--tRNA ligase, partial [Clostridia bacterium]|nr:alanine--tRNA ligase [Clostridia bacterium]
DYIKKILSLEEERFDATIDAGLNILNTLIDDAKEKGLSVIDGEDVFKLYDTYGFPIDLTREIASEQGLELDEDGFTAQMNAQRERARNARSNISGWSNASKTILASLPVTEFTGYTENSSEAKVIAIIDNDEELESVNEGEFSLVLDRTPFYGEGGGQVGDSGSISCDKATVEVIDTKKTDGVYIHICRMVSGTLTKGECVTAQINAERRAAIRRNHSAAHLLQAALRAVLGNHVEQAGSYVDESKCRFDFSHYAAMTDEQIAEVESLVNSHILSGEEITVTETDPENAKKMGAMALFGEKYGKVVRVVKMGDFSMELCAGTHLDNTAKVGLLKVVGESSVAAGVRRIEAVTGLGVLELIKEQQQLIDMTAQKLKVNNSRDIAKKAAQLQEELKAGKRELEAANEKLSASKLDAMKANAVDVKGIKLICARIEDNPNNARAVTDKIKAEMPDAVALIAAINGDKLNFACACGKEAVAHGAHAGMLCKAVSAICGGNGGGRPDSAMSGGKDIAKVDEALSAASAILSDMIK